MVSYFDIQIHMKYDMFGERLVNKLELETFSLNAIGFLSIDWNLSSNPLTGNGSKQAKGMHFSVRNLRFCLKLVDCKD